MANSVNSGDNSEEIPENREYNPQLDFFSNKFDPLLALSTRNIKLPGLKVKKYDNLAAYTSAIDKEKNPGNYTKKKVVEQESVIIERRWKEHQLPIPSTKNRKVKNIFTKMEKACGPLEMLKRCVDEEFKVKIYTRNDREVRGYCIAYVIAFDKHFNMALKEVTEKWVRRKKQKTPAFDSVEPIKKTKFQRQFRPPEIKVTPHETDKKLENCSRYVSQLMMRGEHVVLINIIDDRNDVKKVMEGVENKPSAKKEKFFDIFKKMQAKLDIDP
ncbi:U7 snRNA-associated Sm-like protein LSm11 [Diorhabda carinulata]|uniref:U7 snRNA-associated Sm-like protein LSm11 n=1 Tax=Diorhabda carinulata TaxID=1163345 RepID=UPI0025A1A272|nr:U7 snRNA-associated Sm-like protein LSm11 [Diorhabda carinulata]